MFYKLITTTEQRNTNPCCFHEEINLLKNNLLKHYALDMRVNIKYTKKYTKVTMLDVVPPSSGDWQTEFQFRTCGECNNGLFLKFIRLPKAKQRSGLGTYCVKWLESFAQRYSFRYIVFSSYGSAEAFWHKMGYQYCDDPQFINKLYFG